MAIVFSAKAVPASEVVKSHKYKPYKVVNMGIHQAAAVKDVRLLLEKPDRALRMVSFKMHPNERGWQELKKACGGVAYPPKDTEHLKWLDLVRAAIEAKGGIEILEERAPRGHKGDNYIITGVRFFDANVDTLRYFSEISTIRTDKIKSLFAGGNNSDRPGTSHPQEDMQEEGKESTSLLASVLFGEEPPEEGSLDEETEKLLEYMKMGFAGRGSHDR